MENTIMSSNTQGITPAVLSGSRGDGIFAQYINKRISDMNGLKENALYLHNVNVIPELEEVIIYFIKDDEKKALKAIYTKNPVKNRANTFVTAYVADRDANGKIVEWEKIESTEELKELLDLEGISSNNYRIGDIYSLMISMVSTILDKEEENDELIKYFSKIYEMCEVKEDEVIFPIPNIQNIETISAAIQGMWNNISDETKKTIIENINDNANFDEIEKIIKALEKDEFYLKDENISYIDENSLFKLSEDYINSKNSKPIIQADKDMAKTLLEKNKHIQKVERKILNYYLTGLTPSGDVLVIKNQSVRSESFYEDAKTLKDKREKYFAEMFNNNETFLKSLKKNNKNSFLKVLGVWDVLLEKGQKFAFKIDSEEEMSPEEYKKAIEEIKEEMAKDKGLIHEFQTTLNETKKFLETIEKSENFISQSNIYVAKNIIAKLENNAKKNVNIIESFEEFRKLQKNISVALNAFKETIYSYVLNTTIVPTNDLTRFPKTVSNSTTITYKELNKLQKNDNENYNKMALLGFSTKEVGKEKADIVPILIPIALYDNNNNVAKINFSISNITRLTNVINAVRELAEKEMKVDDLYKSQLKNLKEKAIELINSIEKQKGSKLFNNENLQPLIKEIKSSATFEDLKKALDKITEKKLPNVSLTISALRMNSDEVIGYLNKKEFSDSLFYLEALSNLIVVKAIENTKPLNEKTEDSIAPYQQYYVNTALKGNKLFYKKNNELTFLPVPGLGNPEPEEIINSLQESVSNVKLTESEEKMIKEKYGYKSQNQKLKSIYEKMGQIVKNKQTNIVKEMKNKTIKKENIEEKVAETMPEIKPKEIIESYEEENPLIKNQEEIENDIPKEVLFSFEEDELEEDIFNNQKLETIEENLFNDETDEELILNNNRKL